jgi:predicted nucleic acid-binding protein
LPAYFLDSSALVKRYHLEPGSVLVQHVINADNNGIRISRLTVAELISAFAIQVRTQAIGRDDADAFRKQFQDDIATGRFEVFSVTEVEFSLAEKLLESHAFTSRLRALDAIQLSVAIELRDRGLVDYFMAADRALCDVARQEGFRVMIPETV